MPSLMRPFATSDGPATIWTVMGSPWRPSGAYVTVSPTRTSSSSASSSAMTSASSSCAGIARGACEVRAIPGEGISSNASWKSSRGGSTVRRTGEIPGSTARAAVCVSAAASAGSCTYAAGTGIPLADCRNCSSRGENEPMCLI